MADEHVTDDSAMPVERHFGVAEIAKRFGVDDMTIYREMERGRLPYLRVASRRVVPESAILAYVKSRAVGDHPQRPMDPPSPRRASVAAPTVARPRA